MNNFRPLLLLAISFLLTACASSNSGVTAQDAASSRASGSLTPAPGTAGLYIFKEGSLIGLVDSFQVSLDGRLLGLVASGSYLYETLTPGSHIVTTDSSKLNITVRAGQNYFVRQTPTVLDGQVLSSALSIEPPQQGLQEIKQMQVSNYNAR